MSAAEQPDAYVRRMVVNEVLSTRRAAPWRRERPRADVGEPPPLPSAEHGLVERDALWSAVVALPPRQRAVIVLRYYEDLSEQQIADALECSRGTVKSRAAAAASPTCAAPPVRPFPKGTCHDCRPARRAVRPPRPRRGACGRPRHRDAERPADPHASSRGGGRRPRRRAGRRRCRGDTAGGLAGGGLGGRAGGHRPDVDQGAARLRRSRTHPALRWSQRRCQ
ncbi:sigma-70 family RNA polymerase sigma factor [Nocardioides sp. B-3]|uniref:sigma-70 family RNA polymerase sigma factor n=1 Tax=Nocardioides sp. B-3 TaxID=2895565 RepID=UPI002152B24B|nr:sigma-70 family RNA polymerase sigma factor [Nocardioides sp. B-3]UUZ60147.1 sigma-70 family RNA polymerase sigma factor [Nocardioides sp. B-3]